MSPYVELSPSTGGGGTPGGADTQVQYNNASAFGGSANLTWNDTSKQLSLTGGVTSILTTGTIATGQGYTTGTGTIVSIGPANAGVVLLRPNGIASATNQFTVGTTSVTATTPVVLPAATTSTTSLRIPHGVAPTTPTNGDMWTTTAGLYVRINGVTVGPLS